jgi:outer membrane receptor protein involved in Fe transport
MKNGMVATVLCCLLQAPAGSAQSADSARVSGLVVEESTRLPLEFAQVSLMDPADSSQVRGTLSGPEGAFRLQGIRPGHYYLEIGLLGFKTLRTRVFPVPAGSGDTRLGTLVLEPSDMLLKEAEVTADRSALNTAIDRRIYLPEKDLQAQTGSASDVLQNIPSVSVDAEGAVSLRGSSNVTFLINGRPSGLMKANSAAALEQMPASSIERIEVITNPSAKFRPDGTAGIINIVLKKNAQSGFNGTVTANAGLDDRYNGNVSLNYKPGKVNVFTSYGYRQNYFQRRFRDFRINRTPPAGPPTTFDLNSEGIGRSRSHVLNLGLDYAWNQQNTLGWSGSFFQARQRRNQRIFTRLDTPSGPLQAYDTDRRDREDETEMELTARSEHRFDGEDHALELELSFENFSEREESRFSDHFSLPVQPDYTGINTVETSGYATTASAGYVRALGEDMELEAGYEGDFSFNDLDYSSVRYDYVQADFVPDAGKTNRFLVRQDIHAVYATLSREFEAFGVLAGLRAEEVRIGSDFANQRYFKLYPTLHLSYEWNDLSRFTLAYGRRVNRPDPDDLNPFPEYQDPRNAEAGNPDLKPEQIHSAELGYQYRKNDFSLHPALYYRYKYHAITEITRYLNDTTLLTTYHNLSNSQAAGLELVLSWDWEKKISLNFSSNAFYSTIDASNLGYDGMKSIVSWDGRLAASFNVSPTTRLQLNGNYFAGALSAQGRNRPVYFINGGIRQEIFGKKAAVTLTATDLFNTLKWVEELDTPALYRKSTRQRISRIVYLGFSYRFGLATKKAGEDMWFEE